jgi:3-oxoadipate enol-lactonase
MPEIDAASCGLFYVAEGPAEAPTLLLSNALGTTSALWDAQLPTLRRSFRVIRYDTRGHGRSAAPTGPYALERLGQDALAVLDAAGAGRSHVCGISLGGLTALWLGIYAPERVGRLVIANSAARIGTAALWQERMRDARQEGLSALAEAASLRWFTPGFRERDPKTVEAFRCGLATCALEGYVGCSAALAHADLRHEIGAITAPSLVIAGRHDVATPPAAGESLCAGIPGARLLALEAAHLSNVEAAEAFTSAVVEFLSA